MVEFYRDLSDGENFAILIPINTNRHTYFGWILKVKKSQTINLDDFFVGLL